MSAPNAPISVAAFPANGAAAFSFTSGGGGAATAYNIYLATDTGFTTSYGNGTASPIKTTTALTNGQSYQFVIVASNGSGNSSTSSSVTVVPATTVTLGAFTDPLLDNTTYNMNGNFTISTTATPFPILGSGTGITFNGNGNTITITTITVWGGLFNKWVDVNSLGILATSTTLLYYNATNVSSMFGGAGWFFAAYTGGTATDCYSTGPIRGTNINNPVGGIFGAGADFYAAGKTVSATRCYSTGTIGSTCGGIFGKYAGCTSNSTVIATDCYSTGNQAGTGGSGGIFGQYAGYISGATVTALRCRSTGTISFNGSGGIFGGGTSVAAGATIYATNCYSTGNQTSSGSGGIVGSRGSGTTIITNCYSTGNMVNYSSGGIICLDNGKGPLTLTNCFATGTITGATGRAGMLWGIEYGSTSAVPITVTNCYYVGSTPGPTTVASGYGRMPVINITNTGGSATWSDSDANTYLTGYPGDTVNARVWYQIENAANTAYRFSLVTGPPAITSVTAGDASASLSWTTPTTYGLSILWYNVYKSTDGTTYTRVATNNITRTNLTDTTVTVTGLTNGTAHTFKVTTVDNSAESLQSAASSSVTPQAAATAVGTPAPTAPFTTTSTSVVVVWTNGALNGNASITNDVILCNSDGTAITTYSGVSSPYTVTVSAGSTNYFKVAARGNVVTTTVYSIVVGSLGYVTAAVAVAQQIANNDTSYYARYLATAASSSDGIIELRAAIKPLASLGNRGAAKRQAIAALIANYGSSIEISSGANGTAAFLATLDSCKSPAPSSTLPTLVILPTYTLSGGNYVAAYTIPDAEATVITDLIKYVVYEIPISTTGVGGVTYTLTLTRGASSVSLTYDGTVLKNGGTNYSTGDTLVIGTLSIPLVGLGSAEGGGGSSNNSLASVVVNSTTLTASGTTYTTSISPHADTVPVTITTTEAHATVSVGTLSAATNVVTGSLNVITGSNTFTITVTAQNGSVATYTLNVTDAASAQGDPYVTTFSNISYKLPALDAPIRYFQTMEEGKLLTINAQLKTIERSEMTDDTLRSLLMLRNKMTLTQYSNLVEKLKKPETLCFFERISIQHGDQRLVVNLWDSTFNLVENTLRCAAEKVERPDLLKKAGGIYNGYKTDTIKLTIGSTSVFLSVYDSPMIKNGIAIESRTLKGANGVIVNALSPGAMTLRSLASVEPVSTRDSLKAVTKVETFVDHDGVRSKNIVSYK